MLHRGVLGEACDKHGAVVLFGDIGRCVVQVVDVSPVGFREPFGTLFLLSFEAASVWLQNSVQWPELFPGLGALHWCICMSLGGGRKLIVRHDNLGANGTAISGGHSGPRQSCLDVSDWGFLLGLIGDELRAVEFGRVVHLNFTR